MAPADQIAEVVQTAQDELQSLQDEVGYDNAELAEQVEEVEDRLPCFAAE